MLYNSAQAFIQRQEYSYSPATRQYENTRELYLYIQSRNAEDDDVIEACAPQLSVYNQHPVDRCGRVGDA